jgi:hypothetical protein
MGPSSSPSAWRGSGVSRDPQVLAVALAPPSPSPTRHVPSPKLYKMSNSGQSDCDPSFIFNIAFLEGKVRGPCCSVDQWMCLALRVPHTAEHARWLRAQSMPCSSMRLSRHPTQAAQPRDWCVVLRIMMRVLFVPPPRSSSPHPRTAPRVCQGGCSCEGSRAWWYGKCVAAWHPGRTHSCSISPGVW